MDDDLLVYEVFPYHLPPSVDGHLKIRFKKVNHGLMLSMKKVSGRTKADGENDEDDIRRNRVRWLRPFDDISGYSGVTTDKFSWLGVKYFAATTYFLSNCKVNIIQNLLGEHIYLPHSSFLITYYFESNLISYLDHFCKQ